MSFVISYQLLIGYFYGDCMHRKKGMGNSAEGWDKERAGVLVEGHERVIN